MDGSSCESDRIIFGHSSSTDLEPVRLRSGVIKTSMAGDPPSRITGQNCGSMVFLFPPELIADDLVVALRVEMFNGAGAVIEKVPESCIFEEARGAKGTPRDRILQSTCSSPKYHGASVKLLAATSFVLSEAPLEAAHEKRNQDPLCLLSR